MPQLTPEEHGATNEAIDTHRAHRPNESEPMDIESANQHIWDRVRPEGVHNTDMPHVKPHPTVPGYWHWDEGRDSPHSAPPVQKPMNKAQLDKEIDTFLDGHRDSQNAGGYEDPDPGRGVKTFGTNPFTKRPQLSPR